MDDCILLQKMTPDYPGKLFADQRNRYCLLMEVLAMGKNA
jgi:hypothetical protein